jgi:flagellar assembly protein FliH
MHLFKPLIFDGQVLEIVEEDLEARSDAPARPLHLPDFGAADAGELAPEGGGETGLQLFPLPELGEAQAESAKFKVRKNTVIKEKIFLPMIAAEDESEDPMDVVARESARIMGEAEKEAERVRVQARTELEEAQAKSRQLREEAEAVKVRAEEALRAAQAEAVQIKQAAQEEGFQKGYKDGEEQGLASGAVRIEAVMADLGQMLKNVELARDDVARSLHGEIVALLEACLDKMFMSAGSLAPALVAAVVDAAVSRLHDSNQVTVRISPVNLEQMSSLAPASWKRLQENPRINWQADAQLRPGGCIVETPQTTVDATVETRRSRIFAMLEDVFQQGRGPDLKQIMEEAAQKRKLAADANLEQQNKIFPPGGNEQGQSLPGGAPSASPEGLQSWEDELPADDGW